MGAISCCLHQQIEMAQVEEVQISGHGEEFIHQQLQQTTPEEMSKTATPPATDQGDKMIWQS